MIATIAEVLLTIGFGRSPLIDLPLVFASMSFTGGLLFSCFCGEHL
jgi:hypothetical protein